MNTITSIWGFFFSIQDEVVDTNWSHTQDLISNAVGPLSRERRQKGCQHPTRQNMGHVSPCFLTEGWYS